jgi:hypothetical protein
VTPKAVDSDIGGGQFTDLFWIGQICISVSSEAVTEDRRAFRLPSRPHVKFRSVAVSFQSVKHEAQIIQSHSGPSRRSALVIKT